MEKHMQITDILAQTGGLQSIARELGISESQAASGAAALGPAILGGFKKQVQSQPSGLEALAGALGRLGGGGLLDNVTSPQATDVSRGDAVLGEIFGTKEVSRTVAQNAATRTGLDPSILKKMLPLLAMVVAGYMAKKGGVGGGASGGLGGLGGMIGGMLGDRAAGAAGAPRAAGGLASMLDLDGDGNPLDDILRMAGKVKR
jgi:hypothetical protein